MDADVGSGPLCFWFKGHLFDPDWDHDGVTEGCWKVEVGHEAGRDAVETS